LASFLAGPSLAALAALAFLAFGLATAVPVAQAADIAVPGPSYYPKSIPPPAIYDWTGIYFGGHVGGGILIDSVSRTTGNGDHRKSRHLGRSTPGWRHRRFSGGRKLRIRAVGRRH